MHSMDSPALHHHSTTAASITRCVPQRGARNLRQGRLEHGRVGGSSAAMATHGKVCSESSLVMMGR